MFLVIISLYTPFVLSFRIDTSGPLTYFELVQDLWFLIEIFLNFFTAFYDKGVLKIDRSIICKRYLKGWFLFDVISNLPFSLVDLAYFHPVSLQMDQILYLLKYLRLLRLIRFQKVRKILDGLEFFRVSEQANFFLRFFDIGFILIFIVHWIACILYRVASYEETNVGNSWIVFYGLKDSSILEQYVTCLYWAFTTICTVGYGDYHPVTTNERIAVILCMLISSGMFSYIIGDIGRLVRNFNFLSAQFKEKMVYVRQFLQQKEIPASLQMQVERYLEYNWELKKLYNIEEQEVLDQLNDNLRDKITVYFNGKIL